MSKQIVIDIIGDSSKFTKATQDATKSAGGFKGTLSGMGLGMIAAAGGAAVLTGALVKGIEGAMDEEKSVNRLTSAIKANVPAWDGNTDAIFKQISSREKLAFSDDQLRDSLGTLVAATHDVTRAQDLQRTAMDLARFKGIDLTTASEALVKVEGGQFKMLKSLGIQLATGASQTEALAAVQRVAFGQADAYASTTAGKIETAQIHLNDAMEDLGARILPVIIAAVDTFNDALELTASKSLAETSLETFKATRRGAELAAQYGETTVNTELLARATIALEEAGYTGAKGLAAVTHKAGEMNSAIQHAIDLIGLAITGLDKLGRRQGFLKVVSGPQTPVRGATPHAAGGWVGLNGPELGLLGEQGPEYVVPNHRLRGGGGGGVTVVVQGNVVGASGIDELSDMIARRLNLDGV